MKASNSGEEINEFVATQVKLLIVRFSENVSVVGDADMRGDLAEVVEECSVCKSHGSVKINQADFRRSWGGDLKTDSN